MARPQPALDALLARDDRGRAEALEHGKRPPPLGARRAGVDEPELELSEREPQRRVQRAGVLEHGAGGVSRSTSSPPRRRPQPRGLSRLSS